MTSLRSLPPPSVTLALGGLGTAYVFISSAVEAHRGIIPFLNGRLGPCDLKGQSKAKLWAVWFKSAAATTVGTSFLAAALTLTTSYTHPNPTIRRLALISGIASLAIVPVTAISGLLGINERLKELARGTATKGTEGDEEVDELVKGWEKRHLFRMPLYSMAFFTSYVAIVLDGRRIAA
ncbi:hypothetical protein IAT38_005734 [Cryptococcus sp. DSM 104549]